MTLIGESDPESNFPRAPQRKHNFASTQGFAEAQRKVLWKQIAAGGTAHNSPWSFWRIFASAKNESGHIECAFAGSVFLALHLQETHKARLKWNATREHFVRKPQRKSFDATEDARGGLGVGEILGQTQGFAPPPLSESAKPPNWHTPKVGAGGLFRLWKEKSVAQRAFCVHASFPKKWRGNADTFLMKTVHMSQQCPVGRGWEKTVPGWKV